MNASIVQAQRTLGEPENAFLTGKNALAHGGHHHNSGQKRGGTLPSLEKDKCLSCNSTIRDSAANASGGLTNKNPHAMAPVYGGGFALGSPAAPVAGRGSTSSSNNNNNHNHSSTPFLPSTNGGGGGGSSRIASLSDSTSEG